MEIIEGILTTIGVFAGSGLLLDKLFKGYSIKYGQFLTGLSTSPSNAVSSREKTILYYLVSESLRITLLLFSRNNALSFWKTILVSPIIIIIFTILITIVDRFPFEFVGIFDLIKTFTLVNFVAWVFLSLVLGCFLFLGLMFSERIYFIWPSRSWNPLFQILANLITSVFLLTLLLVVIFIMLVNSGLDMSGGVISGFEGAKDIRTLSAIKYETIIAVVGAISLVSILFFSLGNLLQLSFLLLSIFTIFLIRIFKSLTLKFVYINNAIERYPFGYTLFWLSIIMLMFS